MGLWKIDLKELRNTFFSLTDRKILSEKPTQTFDEYQYYMYLMEAKKWVDIHIEIDANDAGDTIKRSCDLQISVFVPLFQYPFMAKKRNEYA
jgi:hypothetical protein